MQSSIWRSAVRRGLFVVWLLWGLGTLAWQIFPIPTNLALLVLVALGLGYSYLLMRWKMPQEPLSDDFRDKTSSGNQMLKEHFITLAIAFPFGLILTVFAQSRLPG
ncbi:hypothetical protein [Devosia sp. CAU 1758]